MFEVKKEDTPPLSKESTAQSSSPDKQSDTSQPSESQHVSESTPHSPPDDRSELLARARSFLASPQVQHQDTAAKRAFLVEKGLHDSEIEDLLRRQPQQPPVIPPRTYPQAPPSNLPVLLLGLARLFSWLAGGAAVLTLVYHRILLPRIAQTSLARNSLKSHHLSLLRRLTTSLSSLKELQSESLSILPHIDPFKESQPYSECNSLADALKIVFDKSKKRDNISQLPSITVLRCGLSDLAKDKDAKDTNPTTEELFSYIEGQIPWLLSEDGMLYENQLWETLSTYRSFEKIVPAITSPETEDPKITTNRWKYVPPIPSDPPPLLESLHTLSSVLPKDTKTRKSPFQHTLQSLSDFTGYISTQVYLPYRPSSTGLGLPNNNGQSTIEEELRKEIRALKGLALNRRSFMPSIARNSLPSPHIRTP
ncbi:hypothetical protein CPB84DRAFT_1840577 [Gymnopilus junonius]|uniref:Peroxisome membrane anchor protein Pex14p N-terminal domain-containing protein n=1 Tax=Gymnopilus junonius TaxID=109634 RepID=A0A9P5P450_GYMJU|nr:hypothetical protein CPB84DRAFT_1840577 [Gymnopilus junonius]